MEIRKFYDLVNTTRMTSLASMKFLPDYDELSAAFDYNNHIITPPDHTQYEDAYSAFK